MESYSRYGDITNKYHNSDIRLIHRTYEMPDIRADMITKDGKKLHIRCRKYIDEASPFIDALVIEDDLIVDSLRFDITKDEEVLKEFLSHFAPNSIKL
jgi:hypothetical protein